MNKLKGDCFNGHDTSFFIVQTLVNMQIFTLVGRVTRLRLVPPTRVNICIYTRPLYNKANLLHSATPGGDITLCF